MRNRWLLFGGVIGLLAIVALFARTRLQQPLINSDNILFEDNYTLNSTVDDDLVVWGESISLEDDSHVDGDVALVGQNIEIDGTVDGDLTAAGSNITLEANGLISGDATFMGSNVTLNGQINGDLMVTSSHLTIAPGATLSGDLYACADSITDERDVPLELQDCEAQHAFNPMQTFADRLSIQNIAILGVMSSAFLSLVLAGVGTLAVAAFPRQISHIEEAVRTRTRSLVVTGVMALLLIIGGLTVFLIILAAAPPLGLILFPLLVIVGLLLVGVAFAGIVTLAIVFGEWILHRTGRSAHPPVVAAAVGSVALVLLLHLPLLVPYGFWVSLLLILGLNTLGIGAAVTTRMGTRPLYHAYLIQG